MAYDVELTDTFGGETNYSWVRRQVIPAPEWTALRDWDGTGHRELKAYQRTVIRRAKAAVGLTGVRGITQSYGDSYEFRPFRICQVMFVSWRDDDND